MSGTSDLISRQAVIDLWERYHPYIAVKANEFDRELRRLQSAQPEPQWIPCSERLPEQYGNYFVSISEEEPDIGTINPYDKRGWSLCDANGFFWASDRGLNVVAWMPLPEPYIERRTDG